VRLSGWCHRIRDHGGLLFIDLRDHYGLSQIVADPDSPAFKTAEKLRSEWVVKIDGEVRKRPAGTENPDLPPARSKSSRPKSRCWSCRRIADAGVRRAGISRRHPAQIPLSGSAARAHPQQHHQARGDHRQPSPPHEEQGFFEFQTPILTASSPEGARDYLVPSRIHPGKFYALPQAPQQFKQLIMVSGFRSLFSDRACSAMRTRGLIGRPASSTSSTSR